MCVKTPGDIPSPNPCRPGTYRDSFGRGQGGFTPIENREKIGRTQTQGGPMRNVIALSAASVLLAGAVAGLFGCSSSDKNGGTGGSGGGSGDGSAGQDGAGTGGSAG